MRYDKPGIYDVRGAILSLGVAHEGRYASTIEGRIDAIDKTCAAISDALTVLLRDLAHRLDSEEAA